MSRKKIANIMIEYLENRINCMNVIKYSKFWKDAIIDQQLGSRINKLVISDIPYVKKDGFETKTNIYVAFQIITYDKDKSYKQTKLSDPYDYRHIALLFKTFDFMSESNDLGFEYFPYIYGVLICHNTDKEQIGGDGFVNMSDTDDSDNISIDTDTDTDSDINIDTDTDTDTDINTNGDTDSASDTNTNGDTDTDTKTEIDKYSNFQQQYTNPNLTNDKLSNAYIFYEEYAGDLEELILTQMEHPSDWYDIVFQLVMIDYFISIVNGYYYSGGYMKGHLYKKISKAYYREYEINSYHFKVSHKYLVVIWDFLCMGQKDDQSHSLNQSKPLFMTNLSNLLKFVEDKKDQLKFPISKRIISLVNDIVSNPENTLMILQTVYTSTSTNPSRIK